MKKSRGLLMVSAVAASVALAVPPASATTTAKLAPPAQLNANGTVSVPVEYTCDANREAWVLVTLEQQKAQEYTEGTASLSLDCSGTRQVVDVVVAGVWGAFDNGRAVAKMRFTSYVPYPGTGPYEEVREAGVIRIAN